VTQGVFTRTDLEKLTTGTGQDVPPAMSLEYRGPRQLDLLLSFGDMAAENVVHVPHKESGEKHQNTLMALSQHGFLSQVTGATHLL